MTSTADRALSPRRRRLLAVEKGLDVAVAIVAIFAGLAALVFTPATVMREVTIPMLIIAWSGFLILGGLASALGRLTGVWIFETAGIVSMGVGALIYLTVLLGVTPRDPGVLFGCGLILIAVLLMARRYVGLQLFLSEPGERGPLDRLADALRVRTGH